MGYSPHPRGTKPPVSTMINFTFSHLNSQVGSVTLLNRRLGHSWVKLRACAWCVPAARLAFSPLCAHTTSHQLYTGEQSKRMPHEPTDGSFFWTSFFLHFSVSPPPPAWLPASSLIQRRWVFSSGGVPRANPGDRTIDFRERQPSTIFNLPTGSEGLCQWCANDESHQD